MGFIQSLQSKKGKKFMGYLYGWGAAIVIIGAMFKIQHWPGASPMLVSGLSIEAVIFFFSAFEPIHEETDWSLVYPELRGMHDDDHDAHGSHAKKEVKKVSGDPIAQKLDAMLEEAKIGPELIESLGSSFKSLSEHASKLNNLTDAESLFIFSGLIRV
jgi:gliding motility-associated protein GldL